MAEYVIDGSQPVNENTYKFPVKGVSQNNIKDTIGATVVEDSSYLNKATNSVSFQNDREKPIFPIYSTDVAGSLRVVGNQMDPPLNDAKTIRNTKDTTAIRNGDFNSFTAKFTSSPSTDSITLCPGRVGITYRGGDATKTVDQPYEACTQSGGGRTDLPVVTRFGRWNETDGYTGSFWDERDASVGDWSRPTEDEANPNKNPPSWMSNHFGWILESWVEGRQGVPKVMGIDYGIKEVGTPLTIYRSAVFDPGLVLDGCSPDGSLSVVNKTGRYDLWFDWSPALFEVKEGSGPYVRLSGSNRYYRVDPSDATIPRIVKTTVVGAGSSYVEFDFRPVTPQPVHCDNNGNPSTKLASLQQEYYGYLWPATQPASEYPNRYTELASDEMYFASSEFYGVYPTYWGTSPTPLTPTDVINLVNSKLNLTDPNTHTVKEALINKRYQRVPGPDHSWIRGTDTSNYGYLPELTFNANNEYIWMIHPSQGGTAFADRNGSFRYDATAPSAMTKANHTASDFNRDSLWSAGFNTLYPHYANMTIYISNSPVTLNSLTCGWSKSSLTSNGFW